MFSNNAAMDLYYCTDKGQDILKSCTIQANKENLSYCSPALFAPVLCFVPARPPRAEPWP